MEELISHLHKLLFFCPKKLLFSVASLWICSSLPWLILTHAKNRVWLSSPVPFGFFSLVSLRVHVCVCVCERSPTHVCLCAHEFRPSCVSLPHRLSTTHIKQPTEFCQYHWLDSPTTSPILSAYLVATHTPPLSVMTHQSYLHDRP